MHAKPMKRTLTFLLAVMMMGSLFSACSPFTRDTPYTFRVPGVASGELQWRVKLSKSDVVSYTVQASEDGQTDVVFTGLRTGSTDATIFFARADEAVQEAEDVYVLTLRVDLMKNVTQSEPAYGAYTVRYDGDVTGAEWCVDVSDEQIVHWQSDREYPKKSSDKDGMQEFKQLYTFTGRRPGTTHVRIYTTYPWGEGVGRSHGDFWLLVDDEYRVSLLEPEDFTSFRVSKQNSAAIHNVYEAQRTEDGVRLSHYEATYFWSDEENDYVETRTNETVIDGDAALYMYLAGLVRACGVAGWDGFHKSDPRIMDGTMFEFEAKLSSGGTVSASGSNAYPDHFREFWSGLDGVFAAQAAAQ